MAIYEGSRYQGSDVVAVRDENEVKRFVPDVRRNENEVENITKTEVTGAMELDHVAFEINGKEEDWWTIAIINDIKFPFNLDIGNRLDLPSADDIRRLKNSKRS